MEFTEEQLKIIEEMNKAQKDELKKMNDFITVVQDRTAILKKEANELDARLIYDDQTLDQVCMSSVARMLTLRSNSHAVKPGVSNRDFREMIVNEMFRVFLDLDDNEKKANEDYTNDIKEATDRLKKLDMISQSLQSNDERKGMKRLMESLEEFIEKGVVTELAQVTYDEFVKTVQSYYSLLDKVKEIDQTAIVLDKKPSSTLRYGLEKRLEEDVSNKRKIIQNALNSF